MLRAPSDPFADESAAPVGPAEDRKPLGGRPGAEWQRHGRAARGRRVGGGAPERLDWHPVAAGVQQRQNAVARVVPKLGRDGVARARASELGGVPVRELGGADDLAAREIADLEAHRREALGTPRDPRMGLAALRDGGSGEQGGGDGRRRETDINKQTKQGD